METTTEYLNATAERAKEMKKSVMIMFWRLELLILALGGIGMRLRMHGFILSWRNWRCGLNNWRRTVAAAALVMALLKKKKL